MPVPVMALLAGAQLVKGIVGASVSAPKVKRPTLTENPFVATALANAQSEYANKGMTGAEELQAKIDQESAGYINQAKASSSGSDFIAGLATVQAGKMAQEAEMTYMGAQEDKADLQALNQQLAISADDHNRVQDWNVIGKYQDEFQRKQAKAAAIAGAVSGAVDTGMNYFSGTQALKNNQTLYGKAPVVSAPQVPTTTPSAWTAAALSGIGTTLPKPKFTPFKPLG